MRKNAFIGFGVCVAAFLLALVVNWVTEDGLWQTVAITLGTAVYHYGLRLIAGEISAWAHRFALNPNNVWFQQKKWEPGLYRLLRLRKWKRKLPTYAPDSFALQKTSVAVVIQNTCHAEIVHEVLAMLSFVPVIFSIWFGAFVVFFLTSLAAAIVELVFSGLQRFNRPRLLRLQAKMKD